MTALGDTPAGEHHADQTSAPECDENGDAEMGEVPAPEQAEEASHAAPEVPGAAASSSLKAVKQEQQVVPPSEAWRLDKYGRPCSPEALYMRFYRWLRSFLAW